MALASIEAGRFDQDQAFGESISDIMERVRTAALILIGRQEALKSSRLLSKTVRPDTTPFSDNISGI